MMGFVFFLFATSGAVSPSKLPVSFRSSLWVLTILRSSGEIGGPCPVFLSGAAAADHLPQVYSTPLGWTVVTDSLTDYGPSELVRLEMLLPSSVLSAYAVLALSQVKEACPSTWHKASRIAAPCLKL